MAQICEISQDKKIIRENEKTKCQNEISDLDLG